MYYPEDKYSEADGEYDIEDDDDLLDQDPIENYQVEYDEDDYESEEAYFDDEDEWDPDDE